MECMDLLGGPLLYRGELNISKKEFMLTVAPMLVAARSPLNARCPENSWLCGRLSFSCLEAHGTSQLHIQETRGTPFIYYRLLQLRTGVHVSSFQNILGLRQLSGIPGCHSAVIEFGRVVTVDLGVGFMTVR